jgi:hypothetical protein
MDFFKATYQNGWFEAHPEKIAGEEYETSSFMFPIMVKGTKEDVLRVVGLKQNKIDDVLNDPIIVEEEKQRKKDLKDAGWTEDDVDEMAKFVNKETKNIKLAKHKAKAILILQAQEKLF